jgi:predicted CXXCH cytochrome family protein
MNYSNVICDAFIVVLLFTGTAKAKSTEEIHRGCPTCHTEQEEYKAIKTKVSETCIKCHPASIGGDHPIGVIPRVIPEGLPLDEENTITCITCHEPHGKNTADKLLRKEFNKLCVACHKK